MATGMVWTKPITRLQENIELYGLRLTVRVFDTCVEVGLDAQTVMKVSRPWQDISGNARRGLRVEVVHEGKSIAIYFIHGVDYGLFLELARAGKLAVVWPTLQETIPELRARLRGVAD